MKSWSVQNPRNCFISLSKSEVYSYNRNKDKSSMLISWLPHKFRSLRFYISLKESNVFSLPEHFKFFVIFSYCLHFVKFLCCCVTSHIILPAPQTVCTHWACILSRSQRDSWCIVFSKYVKRLKTKRSSAVKMKNFYILPFYTGWVGLSQKTISSYCPLKSKSR